MKKSICTILAGFALIASAGFAVQAQEEINATPEKRVVIQAGLAAEGFDPGEADGVFGNQTRAAIWDWQRAEESPATGFLTEEQADKLADIGLKALKTAGLTRRGFRWWIPMQRG